MVKDCLSEDDFKKILDDSKSKAVFLIKHSTTCPISRGAMMKFEKWAGEESRADFWRVLVRENRDLSLKIGDETGVEHKSPQVILFRDGKAVRDCSHHAINAHNLGRQLDETE